MIPEKFVYLSLLVSLVGVSFFIRDILKGQARPNLVSWFLWGVAPLVGFFLLHKAGAGASAFPVFLSGFFPFIILGLAIYKHEGFWKITALDIFCGIFSVIALILWIITHKADISILFAILSDVLAGVPTIIKAWKFPETESPLGYSPSIINNSLALLVIKDWKFSIYGFSLYLILLNTSIVYIINRKKITSIFSRTSPQS